jgi:hypothetical protein
VIVATLATASAAAAATGWLSPSAVSHNVQVAMTPAGSIVGSEDPGVVPGAVLRVSMAGPDGTVFRVTSDSGHAGDLAAATCVTLTVTAASGEPVAWATLVDVGGCAVLGTESVRNPIAPRAVGAGQTRSTWLAPSGQGYDIFFGGPERGATSVTLRSEKNRPGAVGKVVKGWYVIYIGTGARAPSISSPSSMLKARSLRPRGGEKGTPVGQMGARWKVAIATAVVIAAAGPAYATTPLAGHTTGAGASEQAPGPAVVPAVVAIGRYLAAFNSASSANQITLGNALTATHFSRDLAFKTALRQEPGAVVLGSALGTFRSAPYQYKPFAIWVFALDPRGPHNQPDEGPPGNHANLEYNYDLVIIRGSSGVVIEEAMGWDKSLPPLPPVNAARK